MADGGGLGSPYTFTGGTYPGTGGDCGATLAAGATCSVDVSFEPAATGTFTDTALVSFNDGASAQNSGQALTGEGANPANLTISETNPYDYGDVAITASLNHIFTVTNSGGVAATTMVETGIGAPYTFTGGTYPGDSGTCGSTLSSGGTCTLDISFTPTATGVQPDLIELDYYNGAIAQTASRQIQGRGVAPANLTITESDPYNYTTVPTGSSNLHSFTITNTGGIVATAMGGSGLAAPYSFAGGTYPGAGGDCGVTLGVGANCDIVVEYAPVATSAPTHDDTIQIDYNNGVTAANVTRDVTGTAVPRDFRE